MSWPTEPCPPGAPTTAVDLLSYIINKAYSESAPNADLIAYRALLCAANAPRWDAQTDTVKCNRVQSAKFFADAQMWASIADELDPQM